MKYTMRASLCAVAVLARGLSIRPDILRFEPIFKATMWVSLVAGTSRLVAWALHGPPAPWLVFLLAIEPVFPVALLLWHAKVRCRA